MKTAGWRLAATFAMLWDKEINSGSSFATYKCFELQIKVFNISGSTLKVWFTDSLQQKKTLKSC